MRCSSCGSDLPEGASFCTECGARLGPPPAPDVGPAPAPDVGPPPAHPAWKWALTVAAVSYAIFGSLLYWSPEIRAEFLATCECEMSQAVKTLAGLFPIWVAVLWVARSIRGRATR